MPELDALSQVGLMASLYVLAVIFIVITNGK